MSEAAGHTFRVFVSSTFSDLKAERNALARWVFPRLRTMCRSRGYEFQAVDLRWGIRDESSADQQTMRICREEIARCQRLSPQPNFVVLMGDRYGWCPLPSALPASELDAMLKHLPRTDADLLSQWYTRDDNVVPAEYLLNPRTGHTLSSAEWEPVERRLTSILRSAGDALARTDARFRRVFGTSASQAEIEDGVLNVANAREHVFAFVRTITNFDELRAALPAAAATELIDTRPNGKWDQPAWEEMKRLRGRLAYRLGENVWRYQTRWTGAGLDQDVIGTVDDATPDAPPDGIEPATLCQAVYWRLATVLVRQMDWLDHVAEDPVLSERQIHESFAATRLRVFVGRTDERRRISDYLSSGTDRPLIIVGPSGAGKSALMARAATDARKDHPTALIVRRFIGASAGTSQVAPLLAGICHELAQAGIGADPVPTGYEPLRADLAERLQFVEADRPVFLFLDAPEQLGDADEGRWLSWLPRELGHHVRIVVSTIPDDGNQSYRAFRYAKEDDFVSLGSMSSDEGADLLDARLAAGGRCLTLVQRDAVLERFRDNANPLYRSLVCEQALGWRSHDRVSFDTLAPDIAGVVQRLFARLAAPEHHGPVLVGAAIGYLVTDRLGISDAEMLDLLARDAAVRADLDQHRHHDIPEEVTDLPPIVWSRLRLDLEPYLVEREAFGARVLSFHHRVLAEEAAALFVPAAAKTAISGRLADYFASRWAEPDAHALRELVFQMIAAGRAAEARQLLFDPLWLLEKLDATDAEAVVEDYDQMEAVKRDDALRLVGAALRLSVPSLETSPDQLAAQLRGRLFHLASTHPEIGVLCAELARTPGQSPLLPRWSRLTRPLTGLVRTFRRDLGDPFALNADGSLVLVANVGHPMSNDETLELRRVSPEGVLRTLDRYKTFENHTARINATALSADDTTALSASAKAASVWDLRSGRRRVFEDTDDPKVAAGAFAANGRCAVAAGADGALKVWDLTSGNVLYRFKGHDSAVTAVAVSRDGQIAVSAASDGTVKQWGLSTGTLIRSLRTAGTAPIGALAISPDGYTVLSGAADGVLCEHDLRTGQELRALPTGGGAAMTVALFGVDVFTAVSGSADGLVRTWDLRAGRVMGTFGRPGDPSITAACLDGDERVIAGNAYGYVVVWNAKHGGLDLVTENAGFDLPAPMDSFVGLIPGDRVVVEPTAKRFFPGIAVSALALVAPAKRAFVGYADTSLAPLDLTTGELGPRLVDSNLTDKPLVHPVWVDRDGTTFLAPPQDIRCAAICIRQSEVMASVLYSNGSIRNWSLEGEPMHLFEGAPYALHAAALTPDGSTLLSAANDGTCKIWSMESGEIRHGRTLGGAAATAVAISEDGKAGLIGTADGTVEVWDLAKPRLVRTLKKGDNSVETVAIGSNGELFAAAFDDESLTVWDAASGAERRTLAREPAAAIRFHSDGNGMLLATKDGHFRLWDLTTEPDDGERERHAGPASAVAVARGERGPLILSGSHDRTLRIWDFVSGRPLRSFEGHDDKINAVALSRDGNLAVSASDDKTLRSWDVPSGKQDRIFLGHTEVVRHVAISPDGQSVISGGEDGTIRVWSLRSGEELRRYDAPSREAGVRGQFFAIALAHDGRTVFAAGSKGHIDMWNLDTGGPERSLRLPNGAFQSIALCPDGVTALSVPEWSRTLVLWNLQTGGVVQSTPRERSYSTHVAISPDGKLAAACDGGVVKLLELPSLEECAEVSADGDVLSLAFSDDSEQLVVGDALGNVHFFDVGGSAT